MPGVFNVKIKETYMKTFFLLLWAQKFDETVYVLIPH